MSQDRDKEVHFNNGKGLDSMTGGRVISLSRIEAERY
jgi:hypothetical protein